MIFTMSQSNLRPDTDCDSPHKFKASTFDSSSDDVDDDGDGRADADQWWLSWF